MPSFFKKLILGKELSNPYVNRYHPSHGATPQSPQQILNNIDQATNSHTTGLNPSVRAPVRPVSPTYLQEARRLAGRDPVTGHTLSPQQSDSYAARSGQSISPTGYGNPQPYPVQQMSENSHATGSDAMMKRAGTREVQTRAEQHGRRTLKRDKQEQAVGTKSDGLLREGRRRRMEGERAQAEGWKEREVGGYFAPERSVMEYYGGTRGAR